MSVASVPRLLEQSLWENLLRKYKTRTGGGKTLQHVATAAFFWVWHPIVFAVLTSGLL